MGRSLLSDEHALCFSAVRGRMLSEADLVLVKGARFDWTFRYGSEIAPEARIVRIDINIPPAGEVLGRGVGLHGDAACVLRQLLDGLDARLAPDSNGCMGVGIPFAIGAKVARPELLGLAFVGDFSFGLSVIELETAVPHRVPVVVAVANNGRPGGAARHRSFFASGEPEQVSHFAPGIRHDLTMASFGGRGLRVEEPGVLGTALAAGEPVCIDVATNENTALAAAI